MSKSQEKRIQCQSDGMSRDELIAEIVKLEQENFLLWDVVSNLMNIRKDDINEQFARLSGRAESGDSK